MTTPNDTTGTRTYPYPGWLWLGSWAGAVKEAVLVVGETPKRLRIRAITDTRLAGRRRYLATGAETLVPRSAVSRRKP